MKKIIILSFFLMYSFNLCGELQFNHQKSPIKHIHIVGERCSGTNFVANLLQYNIEGITVSNQIKVERYGWKHGFIKDATIANSGNCLFIHVYRNPYDWLRSFHLNPYHAHASLQKVLFSKFIETEWHCLNDPTNTQGKNKKIYGTEMLEERDPDTEKRFAHVMHLRTKKLNHFEALRNRVDHFFSAPYEVVNNNPIDFLQIIATHFILKLKKQYTPVIKNGYKKEIYKKKTYPTIASEDLNFINSQLDWDFEQALGYQKNASETCERKIFDQELITSSGITGEAEAELEQALKIFQHD